MIVTDENITNAGLLRWPMRLFNNRELLGSLKFVAKWSLWNNQSNIWLLHHTSRQFHNTVVLLPSYHELSMSIYPTFLYFSMLFSTSIQNVSVLWGDMCKTTGYPFSAKVESKDQKSCQLPPEKHHEQYLHKSLEVCPPPTTWKKIVRFSKIQELDLYQLIFQSWNTKKGQISKKTMQIIGAKPVVSCKQRLVCFLRWKNRLLFRSFQPLAKGQKFNDKTMMVSVIGERMIDKRINAIARILSVWHQDSKIKIRIMIEMTQWWQRINIFKIKLLSSCDAHEGTVVNFVMFLTFCKIVQPSPGVSLV